MGTKPAKTAARAASAKPNHGKPCPRCGEMMTPTHRIERGCPHTIWRCYTCESAYEMRPGRAGGGLRERVA